MAKQSGAMKNSIIWFVLTIILVAAAGFGVYAWQQNEIRELNSKVDSLQKQVDGQTQDGQGQNTDGQDTQNGSNEFTSTNGEVVRVTAPAADSAVSSPLTVTGEVKGSWSFEATFPVELVDGDRNPVAQGFATLQGDWMTTEYVPFEGTLEFAPPAGVSEGFLILRKANPSDLPENDDSVEIPIKF